MLQDQPQPSAPLLAFIVALIFASLTAWVYVVQSFWRGSAPVAFDARRRVPWNGVDLAAVLCVLILVLKCIGHVVLQDYHGGTLPKTPGLIDLAANLGGELLAVAIGLALVKLRSGATAADLGLGTSRLAHYVGIGVVGYLIVITPVTWLQAALSQLAPYHHPLIDAFHERHDALMIIGSTLTAVIVAPFCEEMIFRVLLQGWFESLDSDRRAPRATVVPNAELVSPSAAGTNSQVDVPFAEAAPTSCGNASNTPVVWWPILISSGLFALMHQGQGLAQIPLFFLALVLGYLYQRTHRVWPSLTVHMLLNGGTMLVLWLQVVANPASH